MISGRDTLREVQRAFAEEQARLRDVDGRIAAARERMVEVDAERADRLAALARVRVGAPGEEARPAGARDERVAAMLDARRAARADLEARLDEIDASVARLEAEREPLNDELEAATEALDAAEAETQARLEEDEAYRAQRERAHALERTARHAAEKAAQREEERAEKGRAYEEDPFFMYLWRRGYGTSDYRAWPLARWLDRRVARLVSYDQARANYARLTELPIRLREHADAVAAAAEEAFEELRRLDEEARAADGLDALERRRDEADEALDRHDAAVAEAEAARQEALERLERMERGEDETYAQIVAHLASELDRDDVRALRREALATPYPEDDVVVSRLLDLEAERDRLEETIEDLNASAEASRERLRELQALLRDFVGQRYDVPGSGFPDGDLVGTVLTQFLRGAASREILWRVLEDQQRGPDRRSSPTFGSGGFGRGTPWTGGWIRVGGRGGGRGLFGGGSFGGGLGGGGFGTGGRMSGGGFRTGGRMSGGGFKTGGKM